MIKTNTVHGYILNKFILEIIHSPKQDLRNSNSIQTGVEVATVKMVKATPSRMSETWTLTATNNRELEKGVGWGTWKHSPVLKSDITSRCEVRTGVAQSIVKLQNREQIKTPRGPYTSACTSALSERPKRGEGGANDNESIHLAIHKGWVKTNRQITNRIITRV